MKTQATKSGPSGRIKSTCALMALAGVLALPAATALADSKDGTFPTADQVGGQVYVEPVGVGKKLPRMLGDRRRVHVENSDHLVQTDDRILSQM